MIHAHICTFVDHSFSEFVTKLFVRYIEKSMTYGNHIMGSRKSNNKVICSEFHYQNEGIEGL